MKTEEENLTKEDYEQEEWGGWKIVSDMLDHPDESGIYPTSKCYKELYDFVVAQKKKTLTQQRTELKEKIKGISKQSGSEWAPERVAGKTAYNQALKDILTLIDSMK